jgi:hypothetical protein
MYSELGYLRDSEQLEVGIEETHSMFIAMSRFRVAKGSEGAFENVWLSRDSHLDKVPGFVEFHLLKGPEAEDHIRAGDNKTLYLDHPQFGGFEVRQR